MSQRKSLFRELNRRRFLQSVGIYFVSAWLVLQVAALSFPGIGVDESAIRYVWLGVILGFPLALVFAWRYNVSSAGITRTPNSSIQSDAALSRVDHVVITGLMAASLAIVTTVFLVIFNERTGPSALALNPGLIPSVAVLPFKNLSGDVANEPFTNGIHDDLLTHISSISEIRVISRTSVARLNATLTIPEIGSLLGVSTILEGGVQRYGDRLRINAKLIDAATDRQLWSEQFDRTFSIDSVFTVQTEIASAITNKLKITLAPQDQIKLLRDRPLTLEAYESYLLGRQQLMQRTRESLHEAIRLFEYATKLDSRYALAYVGLADAHLLLNNYGYLPLSEALARAVPALQKALVIDDQLGPVHASIGLSLARQGDFSGAEAAYRRAIKLEPNYAAPYHWLGSILIDDLGRPAEAIPFLHKARERDPLSPVIIVTLGEALHAIGDYDNALTLFKRAYEIDPDYPGAYFLIAQHYRTVAGDMYSAAKWFRRELEIDPARDSSLLGLTMLELGDPDAAEYWFGKATENMIADSYWPRASRILLAVYRESTDLALELARQHLRDFPGDNMSLLVLVSNQYYQEAIDKIAPHYPNLSCESTVSVNWNNLSQAINLSLAYEKTGSTECAQLLLDKALEATKSLSRFGFKGYGIADVEIYARQGKSQFALDALRTAIDSHYRVFWWAQLVRNPHMEFIRNEPAFIAMTEEVRLDMQDQRQKLIQELGSESPVGHE